MLKKEYTVVAGYLALICICIATIFCRHFAGIYSASANQGVFGRICVFLTSHSHFILYLSSAIIIAACGYRLRRLPARFTLKQSHITEAEIKSSEFNSSFFIKHDLEFVADGIKQTLRHFGFSVVEEQSGSEIYFWAEKHRLQRWGMYIANLGIALFMLGAVAGKMFGFEQNVYIVEGAVGKIPESSIAVKLESFNAEYFKNSDVPRAVKSAVEIYENEKLLKKDVVTFNDPLEYRGLRVFQSEFEYVLGTAKVEIEPDEGRKRRKSRIVQVEFGKTVPLQGTNLSVLIESFVPDFGEDEKGAYSRSTQWRNPAMLVSILKNGELAARDWLFNLWPEKPKNVFKKNIKYKIKLVEMGRKYAASFFISSDPGMRIVWVGFGLLLIGIFLKCYLNDRAVKVLLLGENNGTALHISGYSSRDKAGFAVYFNEILREIKNR